MRDMLPLLDKVPFPAIRRGRLDTLQVNVGYRCNQSCFHCHVNAGPNRTEEMSAAVADVVLDFLARRRIATLDITGGAPELNANFRRLVTGARELGIKVMDRCNLTILEQPGQEDLGEFLAANRVEVVASMPCYLQDNVEAPARQGRVRRLDPRPEESSTRSATAAIRRSRSTSSTIRKARRCRRRRLRSKPTTSACWANNYGIVFNKLFVLANMPIQRFGSMLVTKGEFDGYIDLLREAHLDANLDGVMCRNLISVDWRGFVYDCDFNQMLDLPLAHGASASACICPICSTPTSRAIRSAPPAIATAAPPGQGSSCGGALKEAAE